MKPQEGYQFGPFQIDVNERACQRGDEVIPMTGKAFDLLLLLLRDPGRTLTKAELMADLWPDTVVEEKNLAQTIFLLRNALGDDSERPAYIQTVPRHGYKFLPPVTAVGRSQTIPAARPRRPAASARR
jgi:DNA-binding winged helix-turn-helix (wHTH) protein